MYPRPYHRCDCSYNFSHKKDLMSDKENIKEILEKVRQIDIKLRRKVDTVFSGQYRSAFKGQSMVFSDFREYIAGDDIRSISWNLTAKIGRPYIKTFEAESEAALVLAVDISHSMDFGGGDTSKKEVLSLLVGLLAFCAQKNKDPLGLLLFTKNVECYIPPKRDPRQAFYILREVCRSREKKSYGTNFQSAVEHLRKTLKKRSRIFLFSDFFSDKIFESSLRELNIRHELVCIVISDSLEKEFPPLGLMDMEDMETGEIVTFDTSSPLFKKHWQEIVNKRNLSLENQLTRHGIERILIDTKGDIYRPVIDFFKQKQNVRKSYG